MAMQLYSCNGRATNYYITEQGDCINSTTNKMLKGQINKNGYKTYYLSIDGDKVRKYAHRMVAETYIPNPDNKKEVNHKDGNKLNNTIGNLEWCTSTENKRHAVETGLKKTYEIYCFNESKELIAIYKNANSAVELLHLNPSGLRIACENEIKTLYKGYYWSYKKDADFEAKVNVNTGKSKPVGKYNVDGILLETYSSISEAARKNGYTKTRIGECCSGKQKTYKGYIWKFV